MTGNPAPAEAPRVSRRAEAAWMSGVGAVTLALYLCTFSTSVALGDAPESVSGIRSVGILHSPGYPAYVLLGRLWATALPFGSWAARVNFFSVVCATATVVLVYRLARLFDARPAPAALGALAVATSTSFWFNAGFAKHYALSALLVTLAAVLVVSWDRNGNDARLIAAGGVLGVAFGASWELAAIFGVGLVAFLLASERRISARTAGAALGVGALVTGALLAFVVLRARQSPAIDFARPTTAARLVDLLRQKDFLNGAEAPNGVRALPNAPHRALAYLHITTQELGLAVVALAIVGAVVVYMRHRRADTLLFGLVLLANFVGAIFVAGLEHDNGILSGMVVGGFLIDIVVVMGVLTAVGTTALAELGATFAERAGRVRPSFVRAGAVTIAAVAVLVPSLLVHWTYASHRGPDYADDYAHRVLDALPANAVLFTDGWEFGQPIRYEQTVRHERRDVTILSDAEAKSPWYREELQQEAPAIAPAMDVSYVDYISQFLNHAMASGRPVYADMSALGLVQGASGLRLDGVVAQITPPGSGITLAQPIAAASQSLHRMQLADGWLNGVSRRFADRSVSLFEVRADIALAKVGALRGDLAPARVQLADAVRIRPDIASNRAALRLIEANDPGAKAAVLALTGGES
jgi:hypothetical protein